MEICKMKNKKINEFIQFVLISTKVILFKRKL